MVDQPLQIKSAAERQQEYVEYLAKMAGLCVHNAENNTLVLKVWYEYEVDLDRIKSPKQLLGWMLHLGEKVWMDKELLLYFAQIVIHIKGWKVRGF
jgi:hypothetical protein